MTKSTFNNFERLLTPQEAADILGVSTGTLDVWRSTGRYKLPFVRVGKLIRYNRSDLNTFIHQRTKNHTGEY